MPARIRGWLIHPAKWVYTTFAMKNNPAFQLDNEQTKIAVSLYRYVFWADMLGMQFETAFTRDRQELERRLQTKQIAFEPKLLESEMYICLWFGVLYIVIEGWPKLKINEPRITELLRSRFKDLLRNFRNATFHPEDYDDARTQALVDTGQESIDWAKKVTLEFKSFFESILVFP
jgi:hypothetical protein